MLECNPAIEHALVPPDRLVFSAPTGGFTIVDKAGLIRAALACLSQGRPVEEAFEAIEGADQRAEICQHIIDMLKSRGVIRVRSDRSASPASDDMLSTWLQFAGVYKGKELSVGVVGKGVIATQLRSELEALGLANTALKRVEMGHDLIVCCQDHEDISSLRQINREAVEAGLPYLAVRALRHIIATGPLVIPGATACMECAHHRQEINRKELPGLAASLTGGTHSHYTLRLAAMMAGAESARFLFGASYDLHVTHISRYSLLTGKLAQSVILKVPRCPVCGLGRMDSPLQSAYAVCKTEAMEPAE